MVEAAADRLPVLFLWHHHQPFYLAPGAARPVMPWVRLHAVRGYLDMISVAEQTGARMTFNFTPSLLEQLQWAADAEPADEFERVARIPGHELSEEEKKFMLNNFFSINWSVHVKPHPRYRMLLAKRGDPAAPDSLRQAIIDYSGQDFTDLAALFHLAWIGFTGRRDPEIAALIKKGEGYSEADVAAVLVFHRRVVGEVLSSYRKLYMRGGIEISVSPYAHPILPLLCDNRVAAPDLPRQSLPKPEFRRPEDAARHLQLAAAVHQRIWGQPVSGLWPSEGSVSDETLELAAASEFRWAATDQGILERSVRTRTDSIGHFTSYIWQSGDRMIRLYFRDRALSDAIGFRYSGMTAAESVKEFVGHLERIEEATRKISGRCAVIALDGENPWESYPDGGEEFLTRLYGALNAHRRLATMTFSEHLQYGARERAHHLHAGSWIDSNFRIWIGDPEKNQAWVELARARRVIDELNAGDPRRDPCWEWLLRAEGSDWFWWYGEPFNSAYESHFDELFRSFLKALYQSGGRQTPPALDVPIKVPPRPERRVQPPFAITPQIDGRDTHFFEWVGSCRVDPRQYATVMGRAEHSLRALFYGCGEDELYFRFDPASTLHPQTSSVLVLHVLGTTQISVTIPLREKKAVDEGNGVRWALGDIVEVAVRRDAIGAPRGGECQFWVEIQDDGLLLEKLPPSGAYRFIVPTPEMEAANWMV